MSTMIAEVYEAFKEAGVSEEKAKAASEAIADYEERFTKANISMRELDKKIDIRFAAVDVKFAKINGEIVLVKWMLGLLIAINVTVLIKLFL